LTRDLDLLRSKHILIVEHDHLVADQTRQELEECGAVIVGPVPSVDMAVDLLDKVRIDAAILDVNLEGEKVYPLADLLSERKIPFVFATGHETSAMPGRYRGFVLCEKPAELAVIALALFAPERLGH
jgi:DNA-binding response OmpR family regulator